MARTSKPRYLPSSTMPTAGGRGGSVNVGARLRRGAAAVAGRTGAGTRSPRPTRSPGIERPGRVASSSQPLAAIGRVDRSQCRAGEGPARRAKQRAALTATPAATAASLHAAKRCQRPRTGETVCKADDVAWHCSRAIRTLCNVVRVGQRCLRRAERVTRVASGGSARLRRCTCRAVWRRCAASTHGEEGGGAPVGEPQARGHTRCMRSQPALGRALLAALTLNATATPCRTVNKRIKPCYMDMLNLMSCFKARMRRRAWLTPAADAAARNRAAARCV